MKALTVQQPWAWAIVHGGKDVENRTQAWGYRGLLAIHAGARLSERGQQSPLIQQALREQGHVTDEPGHVVMHEDVGQPVGAEVFLSAIIGVVDLVDVHPWYDCIDAGDDMCSPWAETSYAEHGGPDRHDIVHMVLQHPRPLAEPVPCRGALGLWTVPSGVDDQVRLQLPLDVTGTL